MNIVCILPRHVLNNKYKLSYKNLYLSINADLKNSIMKFYLTKVMDRTPDFALHLSEDCVLGEAVLGDDFQLVAQVMHPDRRQKVKLSS